MRLSGNENNLIAKYRLDDEHILLSVNTSKLIVLSKKVNKL